MTTVIKAGETGTVLRRLSTVDLADHLQEARAVVEAAGREAARMVAEARLERERACDEAKQAGYDAGYRQGLEAGKQAGEKSAREEALARFDREQADLVTDLTRIIGELDGMKGDLRIAAERDVLEFAVHLAGKMTCAIGRLNRDAVVTNVRRALELVASQAEVRIRVHPDDSAALELFAGGVLKETGAARAVSIVVDQGVQPGGCVVETRSTKVDAKLETQIEEMVGLLLGASPELDQKKALGRSDEPTEEQGGLGEPEAAGDG